LIIQRRTASIRVAAIIIISLGLTLFVISAIYVSSFLAIFGIGLFIWGAIFLYIAPTKRVPISMLFGQLEVTLENIERQISGAETTESGIYLPPSNSNKDTYLVAIPIKHNVGLPSLAEISAGFVNLENHILVVPPGAALCRLFETELRKSFSELDLNELQTKLPKLLTANLELVEHAEIRSQGSTVILETSWNLLSEICDKTHFQLKTHKLVGCLLVSAVACSIAKTAQKPVSIRRQITIKETKVRLAEYQILEG
jgi:hypothetical protein